MLKSVKQEIIQKEGISKNHAKKSILLIKTSYHPLSPLMYMLNKFQL